MRYILDGAKKILEQEGQLEKLARKYPECKEFMSTPVRMAFYLHERKRGVSHTFAAMSATQRPPGAVTDREFAEGHGTLADQLGGNDNYINEVIGAAKALGYKPGIRDVYMANIARFKGDPMAFISPSGGRGELKKKLELMNIESEGIVKTKARERDDTIKSKRLADDLVERKVNQMIEKNPDLKYKADRRDLREEVISKHGKKVEF